MFASSFYSEYITFMCNGEIIPLIYMVWVQFAFTQFVGLPGRMHDTCMYIGVIRVGIHVYKVGIRVYT